MSGVIAPLRNNQSELGQQTTNLVDLRGALFGQPTADAMQAQNGLLVISLNPESVTSLANIPVKPTSAPTRGDNWVRF
jgi:hypothetical protein